MNGEKEKNEFFKKMPKSVPFVVTNIFFERFCSSGIMGKISKSFLNTKGQIFPL